MKVKLLAKISGPEGNYNIHEEVNLSEKLATALIRDGHAREIKVVEVIEVVETIKEIEPIEEIKPSKKFGGKNVK